MIRTEIDSLPAELDEVTRRIMQLEIEQDGPEEGEGRRLPRAPGGAAEASWPRPEAQRRRDEGAVGGGEGRDPASAQAARGDRADPPRDRSRRARVRPEPGRRAEVRPAAGAGEEAGRCRGAAWRRRPAPARLLQGGGHRGGDRRDRLPLDRHPGHAGCMEGEREKLLKLDEILHERVIGQDEAVRGRGRRGAARPHRPQGPAAGPSARSSSSAPPAWARPSWRATLAEALFDTEENMVRIDMSEYMEKHTRVPAHRRAARLRRLRGGRPAHRGRPAQALLA